MKICIFPGSFNPVHKAHLKMAEFALGNLGFDKVIFIPAYIPPHKNIEKNLAVHRLNMVKLAVSYNPDFEVSDVEYMSEGASYSLITVKKIREKYNISGKLDFLIGTDAFEKLNTWYKVDELKELVHFIVFPRTDKPVNFEYYSQNGYDFEVTSMTFYDISSTSQRKHLTDNTPEKVKEYIIQNGLYNN